MSLERASAFLQVIVSRHVDGVAIKTNERLAEAQ